MQTRRQYHVRAFTFVEVVVASAVLTTTLMALYGTLRASYSMFGDAQQRLDASAIAVDRTLEVFNTLDFSTINTATTLPPEPVPGASALPTNSQIVVRIVPNTDTSTPYRWDIETRVRRGRVWNGSPADSNQDVVVRITRYAVDRN